MAPFFVLPNDERGTQQVQYIVNAIYSGAKGAHWDYRLFYDRYIPVDVTWEDRFQQKYSLLWECAYGVSAELCMLG